MFGRKEAVCHDDKCSKLCLQTQCNGFTNPGIDNPELVVENNDCKIVLPVFIDRNYCGMSCARKSERESASVTERMKEKSCQNEGESG